MTATEMLARMSSREFSEWQALALIEAEERGVTAAPRTPPPPDALDHKLRRWIARTPARRA
jgi:hypothetical protein